MKKIKTFIETLIPMTLGSFVLFSIIIYLMIIVGKTVWNNYQSNTEIAAEELKLADLESSLNYTENEIEYFKTASFREKQARAKLGYIAPGETALSLPPDQPVEVGKKVEEVPVVIKVPNYYLWFEYFSGND